MLWGDSAVRHEDSCSPFNFFIQTIVTMPVLHHTGTLVRCVTVAFTKRIMACIMQRRSSDFATSPPPLLNTYKATRGDRTKRILSYNYNI